MFVVKQQFKKMSESLRALECITTEMKRWTLNELRKRSITKEGRDDTRKELKITRTQRLRVGKRETSRNRALASYWV